MSLHYNDRFIDDDIKLYKYQHGAALALMAVERGANIVRVHDVQTTAEVLAMYKALPRDQI